MTGSALPPIVELSTGYDPVACVIWMHGLGADGNDFVPVVKELGLPEDLPIRFIFPHAPMRAVTINAGHVMRAWYDILSLDGVDRRGDETGIRQSQVAIEALIAKEVSRGMARERIVLAGFSQGGAIALQTALRHKEKLAGVLALSTYLPLADSLAAEAAPANKNIPIFMAHGSHDPVIAMAMAIKSRDFLSSLSYEVDWHEYAIPHSVSMQEISDIGRWLRQRI
jgi:phospholipase/carboxylesterase